MKRKRFADLSPAGRTWASVLIAFSLALVVAAERDLQQRSPAEIEGNKLIWRLVSLNALGALAYFRFGRRTTQD
jgi:hypothetical protein